MKRQTVIAKKRRGPPPTGKVTLIGVRMLDAPLAALDEWIAGQADPDLSRPEAIRRLVELDLTGKARPKQASRARAERAHEMAGEQLDELADRSVPAEEQASRKRNLLKGPEEFRDVRVDRPKKK